MTHRLLASGISLSILGGVLALASLPHLEWIITATITVVLLQAFVEYRALCRKTHVLLVSWPTVIFIIVWTAVRFLSCTEVLPTGACSWAGWIGLSFLVFSEFPCIPGSLSRCAHTFFFFVSVLLPLSLFIDLYHHSWKLVLWLLITVKSGDICAYGIGKLLGTHALAPHISPKKTWEGAAAALLGSSCAGSLGYALLGSSNMMVCLMMSFICGGLGIVGDLAESLIKRDAGVKDSAALPGLGGILDMVDSLLIATPCLYLYLHGVS